MVKETSRVPYIVIVAIVAVIAVVVLVLNMRSEAPAVDEGGALAGEAGVLLAQRPIFYSEQALNSFYGPKNDWRYLSGNRICQELQRGRQLSCITAFLHDEKIFFESVDGRINGSLESCGGSRQALEKDVYPVSCDLVPRDPLSTCYTQNLNPNSEEPLVGDYIQYMALNSVLCFG